VFGVFLAAFVVLAVVTVRWAVRRDRAGRAEWVRRQAAAEHGGSLDGATANGQTPSRAQRQAAGTGGRPSARALGRNRAGNRRPRGHRPGS
jgi:hypothetical protein